MLAVDGGSAGRGIGKGAISPNCKAVGGGSDATFSAVSIAAAGSGADSRTEAKGKLCPSETGAEPEAGLGSNSAP